MMHGKLLRHTFLTKLPLWPFLSNLSYEASMGMTEYMQKVKFIGNALQATGETESAHNLVMIVLLELLEEYRGFVSAYLHTG